MNGDGRQDLITGQYGGNVFMLLRNADGTFQAPALVLNAQGTPLRVGNWWDDKRRKWVDEGQGHGISATPIDWDADGDLDLVLGTTEGKVFLGLNQGTRETWAFPAEVVPVRTDRGPMRLAAGHVMPVAADWDGDGLFDLVTGATDGSVWWWKNRGEAKAPRFGTEQRLVEPGKQGDAETPGIRSQVDVADWDGDGRMDLLVGDYQSGKGGTKGWVWLHLRAAER